MSFPRVKYWPLFICECCTVRSVLGRELGDTGDLSLLRLERMRLIDVANSWAENTYKAYNTKMGYLRLFEHQHPGLKVLPRPVLDRPPDSRSIPLAWAEEAYSLKASPIKGKDRVSYGTTRQIRSAAGWAHTVSHLVTDGGSWTYDEKGDRLRRVHGLMTQDAVMTRFTRGLQNRIGEDSEPSWALNDRHVRHFDNYFDKNFLAATTPQQRRLWARAGLANTLLWLGWLRAQELFNLRWEDVDRIDPRDGPIHDLPENVGCLLLRLAEQTKTSQTKRADVPVAYATRSGYQAGKWYERLRRNRDCNIPVTQDPSHVFCTEDGEAWTSLYYRTKFVYPLLYQMQRNGDPSLRPLDRSPGNRIEDKYKSLHSYRRGGRSHADIVRDRNSTRRKATPAEVYEHGRWRKPRASESAPTMYREWGLWDRLQITLFCM